MESKHEQDKQIDLQEEITTTHEESTDTDSKATRIGLEQNIVGALCYLAGIISGIVLLIIEEENKFVRFHAMQSVLTFAVLFVVGFILSFIPLFGWILSGLITLVTIVLWLFLMFKAYQNEWYKLPFVGEIAENQVNK